MQRIGLFATLLSASIGFLVLGVATIDVDAQKGGGTGNRVVVLRDDCDPTDPGWLPTGGCTLPKGAVTLDEFNAYRLSPLAPSVIGHQAWWFDPGYLTVKAGRRLHLKNEGGRVHTFTEVEEFGGGRVPPLNASQPGVPPMTPAPECLRPGVIDMPGGSKGVVDGLTPGDHRFQCCIHPWMRTLVKVKGAE